ncbi:MAG: putative amidohydrolase YtcJ [Candidatus Azotimanducaceae bacterium]|jgi:predicted amidohydrolase YtcJ
MAQLMRKLRLNFRSVFLPILILFSLSASADVIISNGIIHTMDPNQAKVEAILTRGDRIIFAGGLDAAKNMASENPDYLDLQGATLTPGFIEAHGHIMSLGRSKLNLDLSTAENYDEVVDQVKSAVALAKPGEWIQGRGWHQSKWVPQPKNMVKGFQTHEKLSAVSPNNPVYLVHASGHAAMANAAAMKIAGINSETEVEGDGEVIKDEQLRPTGVLNEMASRLVKQHLPPADDSTEIKALNLALEEMAKFGITSFQDAGAGKAEIALFKSFLKQKKLSSRFWVMLDGSDQELLLDWYRKGPEIGLGDNHLTIRSIKLVADGALGSRGAWLLDSYSDRQNHIGLPTMSIEYMAKVSNDAFKNNFQVGIHAIGDRANRVVLDVFDDIFSHKNQGVRFRIEHSQHIDPVDIPRFAELGVIASIQGIHMSSDRPWAIDRLGKKRIEEGAYMWKALTDSGAMVINGTDVPVEPINPIASFYALVTRQTLKGLPQGGYEPGQKLNRNQALKTYTINAAYGAFEENIKGSIEAGKLADFTVFDQDLLTVSDDKLLSTKVVMTIVGGKIIYKSATAG